MKTPMLVCHDDGRYLYNHNHSILAVLNKLPLGLTQQQVGEKEWPQMVGGKTSVKSVFGYVSG